MNQYQLVLPRGIPTNYLLKSGCGFRLDFEPSMLRHPEDKEMGFEWVVFGNRNLFFIISPDELQLERLAKAQRCWADQFITYSQVTLVRLPTVRYADLACSEYTAAMAKSDCRTAGQSNAIRTRQHCRT